MKVINYSDGSRLIGHSVGCPFILSLLEKHKASAAYLVSGFIQLLGNDFDEINKTFVEKEFDWATIRKNCPKFYVYHGDNDPYVPLEYAEEMASKLGVKVKVIPNGGHLNEAAGFDKFEELLVDLND